MAAMDDLLVRGATFMKVVRFGEPRSPDAFLVVYLRPANSFLAIGYWPGYERTAAAGGWAQVGDQVSLRGVGAIRADFVPQGERRVFERDFLLGNPKRTPTLHVDSELEGWSLLGWAGTYTYVGETTVIDPDREWLPKSTAEIDDWIRQVIDTCKDVANET